MLICTPSNEYEKYFDRDALPLIIALMCHRDNPLVALLRWFEAQVALMTVFSLSLFWGQMFLIFLLITDYTMFCIVMPTFSFSYPFNLLSIKVLRCSTQQASSLFSDLLWLTLLCRVMTSCQYGPKSEKCFQHLRQIHTSTTTVYLLKRTSFSGMCKALYLPVWGFCAVQLIIGLHSSGQRPTMLCLESAQL